MVRAIAEAGYQPLILPGPDMANAILPYVESGIPVILGLNIDGSVGHAVTVIGRVFTKQKMPNQTRNRLCPRLHCSRRPKRPLYEAPCGQTCQHYMYSFEDQTIKRHLSSGPVELECPVTTPSYP